MRHCEVIILRQGVIGKLVVAEQYEPLRVEHGTRARCLWEKIEIINVNS